MGASGKFDQRLFAYVAGTVTAGLAGAQAADAAVVTFGPFPLEGPSGNPNSGIDSEEVRLDFDTDGTPEFTLTRETQDDINVDGTQLRDKVFLKNGDATSGDSTTNQHVVQNNYIAALAPGTVVDGSLTYGNASGTNEELYSEHSVSKQNQNPIGGNWSVDNVEGNTQYAGLKFVLSSTGQNHFGWLGYDITNPENLSGVVTYGFENVANTPAVIPVPEPTGLALLAVGAAGLLRRKR